MSYSYDGISIQNLRESNMDSLLLRTLKLGHHSACLAVVCDGVGSLRDGGFASGNAIHLLRRWSEEAERKGTAFEKPGEELRLEVGRINEIITEESKKAGIKTASTLSALLLYDKRYYIAHLGDSRIYLLRKHELTQITRDQVHEGKLYSVIGRVAEPEIMYAEGECKSGDRWLLCSDGLYKRTEPDAFGKVMEKANKRTIGAAVKELIGLAMQNGEKDNISAAMVLDE